MISESVVDLSRLQFAITAMYHFLFVPLTLGLAFLLAIMESVYVMTGKQVYKDMVKFWGKLFGINFALGVTTGLTMEFQFGTNWAYYSHYVGDIFGAPLAIEGLMAFFLESTFIGLFFFGWDRLTRVQHLAVTWLVAIGSNMSALWILIANGWMQNPVGAEFNFETMRMELTDFGALLFNPVAQVKFVHTVSAGYVTGAIFVLAISSYYLLKKRDLPFARRSFAIAAVFGLASTLSVIILGDESGYEIGDVQKTKLAAIEAEWETEEAPAAFTLFGLPNQEAQRTDYAVKIPYAMGIIATRSLDQEVTGIKDLIKQHELRIRNGMIAYEFKGGTGTSSRVVPIGGKDYTVAALVQANHGIRPWLTILGKPVGQIALDRSACDDRVRVVAFSSVNSRNQGEYFNGLASTLDVTCQAADDLTRPLGDPQEASIRGALDFLAVGREEVVDAAAAAVGSPVATSKAITPETAP